MRGRVRDRHTSRLQPVPLCGAAAFMLALGACGGGRDDEGGPSRGGSSAGEDFTGCEIERRAALDAPVRTFQCLGPYEGDGPWECDCDGEEREVAAGECGEALGEACDVDPELEADFCEYESLGGCVLDPEGGFECGCDGSPNETIARDEGDCVEALFRACSAPCSRGPASCDPLADRARGYACDCGGRQVTVKGEVVCDEALSVCIPRCEHGGGECYVDQDPTEVGLLCRCGEEPLQSLRYDDLGHDDCEMALVDLCGEAPDATDPVTCEQEGPGGSGSCTVIEVGFECTCTPTDGPPSTSAGGPAPSNCREKLREVCPAAFE